MHIACSVQCAHRRRELAEGQDRDTGRDREQPEAEQQGDHGAPWVAMHRARNSRQGRGTADGQRKTQGAHEGRECQHGKRENRDRVGGLAAHGVVQLARPVHAIPASSQVGERPEADVSVTGGAGSDRSVVTRGGQAPAAPPVGPPVRRPLLAGRAKGAGASGAIHWTPCVCYGVAKTTVGKARTADGHQRRHPVGPLRL